MGPGPRSGNYNINPHSFSHTRVGTTTLTLIPREARLGTLLTLNLTPWEARVDITDINPHTQGG